jgi:hypothetical protein
MTIMLVVGGYLVFQFLAWPNPTPTPVVVMASPQSPQYPPELIQAAVALSTAFAPTPTPTPETPTPEPTPTPSLPICYNLPQDESGVLCEWGEGPEPPTTPIPVCDTPVPFQKCMKEGPVEDWVWEEGDEAR